MLDWQGALEYFVTIAYEVFSGLMPNRNRPAHLAIILSLRACKSSSGRLREEVLASFPAPSIAIKAAEPGTGNLQQSWLINLVPFFQDEIPHTRRRTMKLVRTTVLCAASALFALGLTAAEAQTPGTETSPAAPPAAAPSPGAGGPTGGPPSGGAPGTMGEKGGPAAGPTGTEKGPDAKPGKAAGQTDEAGPGGKAAEDKAKPGAAEGTAETKEKPTTAGEEKAPAATEDRATTEEKPKTTEDKATTEEKPGAPAKGEAAEGKAGTSVKLSSEQVSKVKTHFGEHKPNVKAVSKTEVSVSVGIAIPATVILYDLPPDIIVVEGGCPIKYFLWGDDIVLVDSCTRAVVEIIVIA
jgi:hypothetical protein